MKRFQQKHLINKLAKPSESIEEHTQDLLDNLNTMISLGYVMDSAEISKIKEAILCHDLGKCNAVFQNRLQYGGKYDENKEIPHNVLSFFMMDSQDYQINYAVLNHHHRKDYKKYILNEIYNTSNPIVKQRLENTGIRAYLQDIDEKIELLEEIIEDVKIHRDSYTRILGILNKCDYAASAHLPIEFAPDFLCQSLEQLLKSWKEHNPHAAWNDLQEYCQANKDKNLIVIAPTGMGKTEAGLHWIGNQKGFFILPLRTAINAIYDRVKNDILQNKNVVERIALLHSDSLQMYMRKQSDEQSTEMDILSYYENTRNFSIPLTISTPDQIFDFVFRPGGFELKHAMLSYSKVVIDEIQAYSPELLAVLIRGIQDIIDIGGKVAIFTATFPPFISYLLKRSMHSLSSGMYEDKRYEFRIQSFHHDQKRHHLKVHHGEELSAEEIINHYQSQTYKNKKYLVVCNTVKKAQQIYLALLQSGLENINIFHAKFTKIDRNRLESAIIQCGRTEHTADEIWISTQVVEASLDIDFDYLFTELSDLNSLFQRLGRVNRKGKKSADAANCFVYTEIEKGLLIHGVNGDKGFIDPTIYDLSKQALCGCDGLLTEKRKQQLIEEYFSIEKIKGSAFLKAYEERYKYVYECRSAGFTLAEDSQFRNIFSESVFPVDIDNGMVNESAILKLLDSNNAVAAQINAMVNDAQRQRMQGKKISLSKNPQYQALKLKQNKLINQLMDYTVSVGKYDTIHCMEVIPLSKNHQIKKVYCKYDTCGFRRLRAEEAASIPGATVNREKQDKEDDFDLFI